MIEDVGAKSSMPSAPPLSLLKMKLGLSILLGAIAGMLCYDLEIKHKDWRFSVATILQVSLGMAFLFGLPAGIILSFLDKRKRKATAWAAVVEVL